MANTRGTRGQYHCSFCGKSQDQVRRLIAGPGAVYICDECVDLCREIIDEESAPPTRAKMQLAKLPTTLSACGVSRGILPVLAEEAAQQWTARFNPRPSGEGEILGLLEKSL